MDSETFIGNYLWIAVLIIIAFTIFVAYLLNQNIDESELEDDEEEDIDEF